MHVLDPTRFKRIHPDLAHIGLDADALIFLRGPICQRRLAAPASAHPEIQSIGYRGTGPTPASGTARTGCGSLRCCAQSAIDRTPCLCMDRSILQVVRSDVQRIYAARSSVGQLRPFTESPPPPTEPGGCTNFGPSPPRSPATDILSVLLEVRPSLRRFSESLNKPCRAAILPLQQPLTHGCCYGLNERVVTRDLSSGRRMGERRLAIRSMCVFASRRPQL